MLQPGDVIKPVTDIMEAVGGIKEVWEVEGQGREEAAGQDKYLEIKKRYRRLIKLENGVKEIVMGKEEKEDEQETAAAAAAEDAGTADGDTMDVQAEQEGQRSVVVNGESS